MEVHSYGDDDVKPQLLCNRPLPDALGQYAGAHHLWDAACFAVVSDLTLDGCYGEGALLFCRDRVIAYDAAERAEPEAFQYKDLCNVKVRRMYGNVLFQTDIAGAQETLLRFTYAAAEVAEAAVRFVETVQEGECHDTALESVRASFERMRAFCPKCGRKLRAIDTPCLNCEGGGKAFKKFWVYIKP